MYSTAINKSYYSIVKRTTRSIVKRVLTFNITKWVLMNIGLNYNTFILLSLLVFI